MLGIRGSPSPALASVGPVHTHTLSHTLAQSFSVQNTLTHAQIHTNLFTRHTPAHTYTLLHAVIFVTDPHMCAETCATFSFAHMHHYTPSHIYNIHILVFYIHICLHLCMLAHMHESLTRVNIHPHACLPLLGLDCVGTCERAAVWAKKPGS